MFGGIRKRSDIDHWYFVKDCRSYLGSTDSSSLLKEASTAKENHYGRRFLIKEVYRSMHEEAKIIVPPEFI